MKDKHLIIRIEQCLILGRASNCLRAQYGALLLDAERNVVLMDGYNGGPRGGGALCGGDRCLRGGILAEDIDLVVVAGVWRVMHFVDTTDRRVPLSDCLEDEATAHAELKRIRAEHAALGSERVEVGCHHAEMNLICNAAANGVPCAGAWLIVSGEPCLLCAKLIHHAGIVKVITVMDSYPDNAPGRSYFAEHGVELQALTRDEVNQMARALRGPF